MRLLDHRASLSSALVETANKPNQLIIYLVFVHKHQGHSTLFNCEGNTKGKSRHSSTLQESRHGQGICCDNEETLHRV